MCLLILVNIHQDQSRIILVHQDFFEATLHLAYPFFQLRIFIQVIHPRKLLEPTKTLIYFLVKLFLRKIQGATKPLVSLTLAAQHDPESSRK